LAASQLSAAYHGHVADMGCAHMGMITACIPKGLRCVTTRALVKCRYGHCCGNTVRELVAFYIVRAVKTFDLTNG